jgi:hypothetical protein
MGKPSLRGNILEFIGNIAWDIYLWARGWTEDEYRTLFKLSILREMPQACPHGYNGSCPTCDAMNIVPAKDNHG